MTQDLITGAGLLEPGQRNAEIVYNDMLLRLSALCADCVDSIGPTLPTTVSAPYLMILDGTHATRPNQIAYYWTTGQWFYVQPIKYQIYNNLADGVSYQFVGGSWQVSVFGGGGGGGGGVTIAQVNTAIATHAAADSHSMYLTQAEGDARYVLPSGLNELIDDRVAALLVAGSGTGLTYDDVLNRLTIAFTGVAGSGGATGLKFILNTASGAPAVGEIRSPDLAVGGTIAINPTDTQASASDILGRLGVGAIVSLAKDGSNWVRGTITTAYTVGSGSFAIGDIRTVGAIANAETMYLSIASDAPASASGGGFSAGTISAQATGTTISISETNPPSGSSWPSYTYTWWRSQSGQPAISNWQILSGTAADLTDTGLAAGETYYYRRVVTDGAGAKASSAPASATITSTYEAETIAGINAVEAMGVTLSGLQKNAANSFIVACKTNGSLWTKIKGLYLFIGGTAGAHAVNWRNPGTNNIVWRGSALTHDSVGILGNSSGYGTTGFLFLLSEQNSNGLGVYVKSGAPGTYIGATNGVVTGSYSIAYGSASAVNYASYNSEFNVTQSIAGSKVVTRNGNSLKTFSNGVETAFTQDSTSNVVDSNNIAIFGLSNGTTSAGNITTARLCSAVVFGSGLTTTEGQAYTNADLAYQTALGRN